MNSNVQSDYKIRNPRLDEVPELQNIWNHVFGNIGIDAFFLNFFNTEMCIIAEYNNKPVAMGYLVPFGEIINGFDSISCMMTYSIATLPDHRGKGLGAAIVNKLIDTAFKNNLPVVLCPSDDSLFDYYNSRSGFIDWFYANECVYKNISPYSDPIIPVEISIDEYISMRENLLNKVVHIKHDFQTLQYQVDLCGLLGGGLYKIGDACAVIECQANGAVWIKELLIKHLLKTENKSDFPVSDPALINEIIASIAYLFPAEEYLIRYPSYLNTGRRFGMIKHPVDLCESDLNSGNGFAPWYGMAFD